MASSASGCRARGTGRSRETVTGARPIPVWESDDPALPADRRLRQSRRTRARLRGAPGRPAPALHRRADPAEPRRPDRHSRRCAGSQDVSTCGSTPGRCPSPRCTTRSRTTSGSTTHFPGDFIVEYIGQTRGWFYTLHVLATALFDRPAFRTCVATASCSATTAQKMSKSLRNYPDVNEVFDRDGSDAMRWFLMASPDPARRQPDRHRTGHPRGRPSGAAAAVERV